MARGLPYQQAGHDSTGASAPDRTGQSTHGPSGTGSQGTV